MVSKTERGVMTRSSSASARLEKQKGAIIPGYLMRIQKITRYDIPPNFLENGQKLLRQILLWEIYII